MAKSASDRQLAEGLMRTMVETGPYPGEGNQDFVDQIGAAAEEMGFTTYAVPDPELDGKSLLVAEIGDPEADQILAAVDHSDVVGVEGQQWDTEPRELVERDGRWYGRGTCDTHGSGVSMLLAASHPEVRRVMEQNSARLSVVFTYDEEATSSELSMRGARVAAGLEGIEPVITAPYFVIGEPTEHDGQIVPMRGHKGRYLAHFTVTSPNSGHVSELVGNAFMTGASIVHEIADYARIMRYGSRADEEASVFDPPHTTVQVSAARVKQHDYSTTPDNASFTVDMRTLPFVHDLRATEVSDLIEEFNRQLPGDDSVQIEIEKSAPGSMTDANSPIVELVENVVAYPAQGFNGGDEGRILRREAELEGITMGPGELQYAHRPNESVGIDSVLKAAEAYRAIFLRAPELPRDGDTHGR